MTAHSRQGDEPREGVVLPSNGEPWHPGQNESVQVTPDQGRPWGQPWGPTGDSGSAPAPPSTPAPLPPYQPPAPLPPHTDPHSAQPHSALPHSALPPLTPPRRPPEEPQLLPPQGVPHSPPQSQPVQGSAEETQLLPPQVVPLPPQGAVDGAGLLPPHVPAPPGGYGDGDATQLIPPFSAGSGGAARDSESTQQLRQMRRPLPAESGRQRQSGQPGQFPQSAQPTAAQPQAVPQPPPEFDSLFRPAPDPASGGAPDATQQLPVFGEAAATQQPPPQQPPYGGPTNGGRRGRGSGGGTRNPVVLGALGVAGIIVAGLLGGYALSGGSDDDRKHESQSRPTTPVDDSPEPKAETDPAKAQAKELDKLLAESNDSRDAVIRSVENIKKCEKLGKAAQDLRDAARQRNDLVNRLVKINIDQLPDHERLSTQLTKAWKASAAADDHYAAWADQVAGKKGCKKGQARPTGQLAKGNKASGDATTAKQQAAELWNPTARKYELTERQPAQL